MLQLQTLMPALAASGQGHLHAWWVILAIVVFALVTPLAYFLGHNDGKPLHQ